MPSVLGAQLPLLGALGGASRTNPAAYGAGLFAEPAFFEWGAIRFGYMLNLLQAPGERGSFLMMEHIAYARYETRLFGMERMYGRLGAGIVQVRYDSEGDAINGTDPLLMFELGRRFPMGRVDLTAAGRVSCAFESKTFCAIGLIMGVSAPL